MLLWQDIKGTKRVQVTCCRREQDPALEKKYNEIQQQKIKNSQYLPSIQNGKSYKAVGKDNLYPGEKSINGNKCRNAQT